MKIIFYEFEILFRNFTRRSFEILVAMMLKISAEIRKKVYKKRGSAGGGAFFELTPMKIQI